MSKTNLFKYNMLGILIIGLVFLSCEDWVQDVDPLTDSLLNEALDDEKQLDFLVTGLLGVVSEAGEDNGIENVMWKNALFSDEMTTRVLGHAPDHITWAQIWPFNLQFSEYEWEPMNHARFLADDIVSRVERIGTFTDNSIKERALWWGYTFGGVYRAMMASMYGLTKDGTTPGGVITTIEQVAAGEFGSFQSDQAIFQLAIDRFTEALKYSPGDDAHGVPPGMHDKVVHSFMARVYLWMGDYTNAKAHAELGLPMGEQFEVLKSTSFESKYWDDSGRGPSHRHIASADWRFFDYVMADRSEGEIITSLTEDEDTNGYTASLRGYEGEPGDPGHYETDNPRGGLTNQDERIPLMEEWVMNLINEPDCTPGSNGDCVGYQQDVYVSRSSSFALIDGREMEMVLAECALQPSTGSSDAYSGDLSTALTHINNVRTFHSLTELTAQDATDFDNPESGASTERITLSQTHPDPVNITGPKGLLIVERDKTCWLRGVRHYDQRRWGLWHWSTAGDYWHYQPIPDSEVIQNPNVDRN